MAAPLRPAPDSILDSDEELDMTDAEMDVDGAKPPPKQQQR
jgi:hypothetical protein